MHNILIQMPSVINKFNTKISNRNDIRYSCLCRISLYSVSQVRFFGLKGIAKIVTWYHDTNFEDYTDGMRDFTVD